MGDDACLAALICLVGTAVAVLHSVGLSCSDSAAELGSSRTGT